MPAELRLGEARRLLAQALFGQGEPGFKTGLERVEKALAIIDECCATFDWGAINQLQGRVAELEAEVSVLDGALCAWGRWAHSPDDAVPGSALFEAALEATPARCFPPDPEAARG